MDVPVLDDLKNKKVILKSKAGNVGSVYLKPDKDQVVAMKATKGSMKVFNMTTAPTAGGQLVALQYGKHFMTPEDCARASQMNLRPETIRISKIFDENDEEIDSEKRKYWFRVRTIDDAQVYESLAHPGFYVSVEDKEVLMRKCSEDIPDDPNYHIYAVPPSDKKPDASEQRHIEMYEAEYPRTDDHKENNTDVSNSTITPLMSGSDVNDTIGAEYPRADDHHESNETTNYSIITPLWPGPCANDTVGAEYPSADEHKENNTSASNSTTTPLLPGSDANDTCETLNLTADHHTVASVTSKLTSEHVEANFTSDIQFAEEPAKSLQQSHADRRVVTRTSDAVEGCSEIERNGDSDEPETPEDTATRQQVEEKVIEMSSVTDECGSQGVVESKTNEEEISTKKLTEAGGNRSRVVQLQSDLIADREPAADDSGVEMTSPQKKAIQLDASECHYGNYAGHKKQTVSRKADCVKDDSMKLGKSDRGARKSPLWSKMFSCMSSRNAGD